MGLNLDSKAGQFGMIVAAVVAGKGLYDGIGWVGGKVIGWFSKDKKDAPAPAVAPAPVNVTVTHTAAQPGQNP